MEEFKVHTGRAVFLDRENVDTDQIIPKQFLKRVERTGYGQFLFNDWRFAADGSPKADFVLNDPAAAGAAVLIAGTNFGCGSSREHAPWSLLDHGFRVILAPGFADIFYNNSLKNGLLPVVLSADDCRLLGERSANADHRITVDLERLTVSDNRGYNKAFEIDPFRRHCLLNALDDIALTLIHEDKIAEFERQASVFSLPRAAAP